MTHPSILSLAAFALFASTALAQSPTRGFPTPPPSMNSEKQTRSQTQPLPAPGRRDMRQAQQEAEDLARMAGTIPADVTKVREGMLPKDVLEKLKQIEKISKHLRTELNP